MPSGIDTIAQRYTRKLVMTDQTAPKPIHPLHVYVAAQHVGISDDAADRFLGTLEQCGFTLAALSPPTVDQTAPRKCAGCANIAAPRSDFCSPACAQKHYAALSDLITGKTVSELQDALRKSEAEVAALKGDAERYRWLKSLQPGKGEFRRGHVPQLTFSWPRELADQPDLDAAIDAAIDAAKRSTP